MASRLSSILVHECLLKTDALREILALQVVRGGALDTLLLERKLISESQLTSVLAKSTGFAPLQPEIMAHIDLASGEQLPQETALQLDICPITREGNNLSLLVSEAVDQVALEELAYELDCRISPYVAPAARIVQARQQAYGIEISARFRRLLTRLGDVPQPVGASLSGSWLSAGQRSTTIEPRKQEPQSAQEAQETQEQLEGVAVPSPLASEEAETTHALEPEASQEDELPPDIPPVPDDAGDENRGDDGLAAAEKESAQEQPLPEQETEAVVTPAEEAEAADVVKPDEITAVESPQLLEDVEAARDGGAAAALAATAEPDEITLVDRPLPLAEELAEEESIAANAPAARLPAIAEPDEITLVDRPPPLAEELAEEEPIAANAPAARLPVIAEPDEITLVVSPPPLAEGEQLPTNAPAARLPFIAEPDEITLIGRPSPIEDPPAPPATENFPETAAISSTPPLPLLQVPTHLDEESMLAIRQAQSRDELLIAVLRAVNQYLDCAQVYVTKQGRLQGHLELSSGHLDNVEIRNRRLSLESPSIISRSVEDGSVFIGPAPSTDASTTTLLAAGILSLNGLVLVPIVMKQKTVCLVVGHNYDQPISTQLRPLLMQLSQESALALAELIQRQKISPKPDRRAAGTGKREGPVGGPAALRASSIVTSGNIDTETPPVGSPAVSSAPPPVGQEVVIAAVTPDAAALPEPSANASGIPRGGYPFDTVKAIEQLPGQTPATEASEARGANVQAEAGAADEPPPLDGAVQPNEAPPASQTETPAMDLFFLLDELERDDALSRPAEEKLLKMGTTAIQALIARFPGRLRFNRYAPHSELPPVEECSALLRCLKRFGRQVLLGIPPLLHHRDVDVRFYATYLMSELIYPEAVALLAARLQDKNPEVRRIAGQILRRFQELDQYPAVLLDLRDDLKNPNPRPRKAATEAIAALGDAGSVPALIELLEDPEVEVAEAASNALVTLTKQDFAQNSRRWTQWWQDHCHQHRLEWLFDALLHKAPELRASAATELEENTGLELGYRFDMERSEREAIHGRYLEWWSQEGSKRFAS